MFFVVTELRHNGNVFVLPSTINTPINKNDQHRLPGPFRQMAQ